MAVGKTYPAPEWAKSTSAQGAIVNAARVMDAFANPAARLGYGSGNLLESTQYPLTRKSWNYIELVSLYRSNWLAQTVINAIPEDMLKNWVEIQSQIDPKQIRQFEVIVENTATRGKITEALQWGRLFGGAGAIMVIDGQQNRLQEPLDLDDVPLGGYLGLQVFDRWSGIVPSSEVISDMSNPEFGMPEFYSISPGSYSAGGEIKIHHSRVLRFAGRNLPRWEKQAEQYWGLSEIEIIWDALRMSDNTEWNIASLMFAANVFVLKTGQNDLSQMLALGTAQQQQRLLATLQAQRRLLSNNAMLLVDKDGGLESRQIAFGGLAEVWEQFRLTVCAAAEIPMSRLFGRTQTGLGQGNEGDEQNYYEKLGQKQNAQLRPQFNKLFSVVAMSTWGKVPKDFAWNFRPIRNPGDKERAELGKVVSDSVNQSYSSGIVKKSVALKELKQYSPVTGMWSNISDEDIEEAENEPDVSMDELAGLKGLIDSGDDLKAETKAAKKRKAQDAETTNRRNSEIVFAGFPVTIEYRKGDRRRLTNAAGDVVYDRLMKFGYGFIQDTVGRDGDEIDVILGMDQESNVVFVCDMVDLGPDIDKREDEDKVCLGFSSVAAATEAFLSMYPESFLGGIRKYSLAEFREMIAVEEAIAA